MNLLEIKPQRGTPTKIRNNFRAVSQGFAWLSLGLICCISFGYMLWASRTDSAIDDELAHIPAGYGYVHNLDYRLNPEHPPLVKALALLPVLFLNPTFPTQSNAWMNQINAQWDMGTEFLYESGNDANAIIRTARIFPILITIALIILVYLFARRRVGAWWGLLPASMIALSPTILAHGHYVTTDVGAAFGITLSIFFFVRFIESSSTKNLWLSGISFGIAQIMKFSAPLLIPLFIFVFGVLWLREIALQTPGNRNAIKKAWRYLRNLILIFAIGYLFIVYPVYGLFTARYPITKQFSDTQAMLTSFGNGAAPLGQPCKGMRCLADADIWMAQNPVLRPFAEYALGVLMVMQRADAGNTIYFLGHVVQSGGPIYFPLLYLLKEPLPSLAIVVIALLLALWSIFKTILGNHTVRQDIKSLSDYLGTHVPEFTMISFIIIYWGYSMQSPLNIGIRHIIPTIPLIYILAAGTWKGWITRFDITRIMNAAAPFKAMATSATLSALKYLLLILLLAWLFIETAFAAPYFLSYFNELGGGVWNGYHYVTDSNYDWGQDLLRLQAFANAHPEIDRIAVDYFGGGNPKYYLGAKEIAWSPSKGNPVGQNIHWLAISINTLEGAIQPLGPGQSRNASDTYAWLTALRPSALRMGDVPPPDYRIGTSIFVYHL